MNIFTKLKLFYKSQTAFWHKVDSLNEAYFGALIFYITLLIIYNAIGSIAHIFNPQIPSVLSYINSPVTMTTIIVGWISPIFISLLLFIFVKSYSKDAKFSKTFQAVFYTTGSLMIPYILLSPFFSNPIAVRIIFTVLGIYSIYSTYLGIKILNKLTNKQAIVSTISSCVIFIILVIITAIGTIFTLLNNVSNNLTQSATSTVAFSTTNDPHTYSDGNISFTLPKDWKLSSFSNLGEGRLSASELNGNGDAHIISNEINSSSSENYNETLIKILKLTFGDAAQDIKEVDINGYKMVHAGGTLHGEEIFDYYGFRYNNNTYQFLFDSKSSSTVSLTKPYFDQILNSITYK